MIKGFSGKIVPRITAWSFSRWSTHDECPYLAKLLFIEKRKAPGSPAMDRGDRLHKAAEAFVKGETQTLDPELKPVAKDILRYKKLAAAPEIMLAVTREWTSTGWFDANVWARIKIDVLALVTRRRVVTAEVVDYKTGQYKPESESYAKQLSLYAAGTLAVHPEVERVDTKLLFTDHNKEVTETYDRSELPALKAAWEARVAPMLADTVFAPRPGWYCRYCHFSKSKAGPCEF